MKPVYQILSVFSCFLILVACRKENEVCVDQIYRTWEAKKFMSVESVAYPKNENKPILITFDAEGNYLLKLDVNSCFGKVDFSENNRIEIEPAVCTEACCDSRFSEKLVTMLPEVTTFGIEGNTLKLNVPGWGYIECELVK